MRAKRLTIVLAGSLLALGVVRLTAQSLGDVAKKEEERRKQVAGSGKTYTNKDLAPAPPSSTPAPATSAPGDSTPDAAAKEPEKAADAKDANKPAEPGQKKDQAYWSGRMKSAQDAIDRDSTLADAMQSRINALTTDFVNRDDPAQRAGIERDRQRALSELDRLKKQIVADKKAVADLEEEARRAGVPPGWLR
jgi:hypothetical protein